MKLSFLLVVFATLFSLNFSYVSKSLKSNSDSSFESSLAQHNREKRDIFAVFLIAVSITSKSLWIYRSTVKCTGYAPNLDANSKKATEDQKELWNLKESVNLQYVPVYSKDQYIRRFGANVAILHQAFLQFHQLGEDIMYNVDSTLSEKLKEAAKDTDNPDFTFDDFQKVIDTASKYGNVLSTKLETLEMFSRTKFDLPKLNRLVMISTYVALTKKTIEFFKSVLDKLAPGVVGTMIRNALRITDNAPKVAPATATASDPVKPNWKIAKNFIVSTAGWLVGGFQLITEIVDQLRFKKNCLDMDAKVEKVLEVQAKARKNMTEIAKKIQDANLSLEKYYHELKMNLTEVLVIPFLKQMKSILDGQPSYVTEILQFDNYINKINTAGYEETDTLNEDLVKSVVSVNLKLNCIFKKLQTLRYAIDECEYGKGDVRTHYNTVVSKLSQLPKGCITQLSFSSFDSTMSTAMSLKNLQPVCARNDRNKQALICEKINGGDSIDNILNDMASLTRDDVEYYASKCGNAQLTNSDRKLICSLKKDGVSLADVTKRFDKYDMNAVNQVYKQQCKLDNSQINEICTLKNSLETLAHIQGKFSHYDPASVKARYVNCVKSKNITPNDEMLICTFKKQGFTIKDHPAFYSSFFQKYDASAVNDVYNKC